MLPWESGFLKIPQKSLPFCWFFFQKNSTRTAREGCLPKEDQNNNVVLREVSLAAMIFHGGLITLPPVPKFIPKGTHDIGGQAHTKRPGTVGE